MKQPLKILFAGTPEFAASFLSALLADEDVVVVGVITQPDRPGGRQKLPLPSPVKVLALERQLPIFQPEKMAGDEKLLSQLKKLEPDFLVVAAFGQLIPQAILSLARRGNINVHPSLLPKYRGASPIQSALLAGERETGLTIMLMDEKMDHGAILAQKKFILGGEETSRSLHEKMAVAGVKLLLPTLKKFAAGQLKPQEQDHSQATFCRTISRADGRLDWTRPAEELSRQIRAFFPWPGSWTMLCEQRVKIFPPLKIVKEQKKPGEIFLFSGQLAVGAGQDSLILEQLQPAGKKIMSGQDFQRGYRAVGRRFV